MAQNYVPAEVPQVGKILSVILQLSTFSLLTICTMRRTQSVRKWSLLPLATWLIIIIYCDSAAFVFATTVLVYGFGINSSPQVCEGGVLLCLICYMSTKVLTYCFLVEKAYIVRGSLMPRLKTKLWLFNCLFMLLPYAVFIVMNFIYRITYINSDGVCIIGMEKISMFPFIAFEIAVNIYLTLLFILPLRNLTWYQTNQDPALRRTAMRSLIGCLATLTTSVANLTVSMMLIGEPGWICLMCCNADILFCALVLHWVTSKDQTEKTTFGSNRNVSQITERVGGGLGTKRASGLAFSTKAIHHVEPNIEGEKREVNVTATKTENDIDIMHNNNSISQAVFPTPPPHANPFHTVTTECCSVSAAPPRRSRGFNRIASVEDFNENMEMRNIYVKTSHKIEVNIERGEEECPK